jgi:hypothetical protein
MVGKARAWEPLATARYDAKPEKDLEMNSSSTIVLPTSVPATTDTGRIRLGGGWRLPLPRLLPADGAATG